MVVMLPLMRINDVKLLCLPNSKCYKREVNLQIFTQSSSATGERDQIIVSSGKWKFYLFVLFFVS